MKVFESLHLWQEFRKNLAPKSLGFVPTMGALHEGHDSLVLRSLNENSVTLVSLFVNPTQFDNASDFQNYPNTLVEDLSRLESSGVDFVLVPKEHEIYFDNYRYHVTENNLSLKFCGPHRPGHFEGVLTVVLKLLNLAQPHKAYFGEKDYQQYLLIKGMAESFFLPSEIILCPTVRDAKGLALSSRNKRLSESQMSLARSFPEILKKSTSPELAREALEAQGFKVDYVEDFEDRRLGAIFIDNVRLIDNVKI